jgi:hypothetical protein
LLDMMGSMFFGGGQGQGQAGGRSTKKVEAPPSNMELD